MPKVLHPGAWGTAMALVAWAFAVFHLMVLLRVVPHTVIWGGRISGRGQIVTMELVSLLVIAAAGVTAYLRGRSLTAGHAVPALGALMWILAGLFALNSLGNLFAETNFERFAFTPVTLFLSFASIRLALG